MNIGFDAKRAFFNRTGLGNYSRSVIESLATNYPENNYYLYSPKPLDNNPYQIPKGTFLKTPEAKLTPSIWRSWLITNQLKKDKIDIYHGLSNEIPFSIKRSDIRTIVTIHDLIFMRYPEMYPFFDSKIYEKKTRFACKNVQRIIAASEQTKSDIVNFLDIPESKIDVVYQNCSPIFSLKKSEDELQTIKAKYGLPDKYLLSVGTIEQRKNLSLTIRSLPAIHSSIKLVVMGRPTTYVEKIKQLIKELKLEDRVIFLNDVPFSDFPSIYQLASIFIFPSLFEGFGIPILEALQSGIPVIAATGSCLEETGGPSTIYIHPMDNLALSESINKVLNDDELKSNMIINGLKFAEKFSPEKIAFKIMQVYEKCLN